MVRAWVDKFEGKIKILTDDASAENFLKVTKTESQFIPWKKKWGMITTTTKIFDSKKKDKATGGIEFTLGLGWAAFVASTFKPYISIDDYNNLLTAIMSENYRTVPFKELRDYQNDDVLHLLKYKIGLFSCYTSYGKTQVIATLANYFHRIGKRVLLVAPGTKARDELVKRCKTAFNLDVPNADLSVNCTITSGLLNRNDVKDPTKLAELEKLWKSYEVVLCDEVEYTVNDSGDFLYSRLTGADCLYGFSGTADKEKAELITFVNGLDDVVIRNRGLIKYFGPSLVYRLPLKMDIDLIRVRTHALDVLNIDTSMFDANTNTYLAVMTNILTDPGVCKVMCKIIEKYPTTYIPINNLNNIIYYWIDNYFVGRFRILLICGEGYIYYDLSGNRTVLKDLQEAWNYVDQGLVDVIPSTSSGYRALDLPKLENMICLQGKVAGVVLQSIGRIARGKHMNVLTLSGMTKKKIPVYTKGCEERDELIKNYYKYCNIVESEIQESNL